MKATRKEHVHAEIDMAPMIDMVFQLLIFFMCAATLSRVDFTPEVALPVAEKAQVPEDLRDRGTINILPDGRYMISGEYVEEKDMLAIMQRQRAQNPNLKLYLRANHAVPFARVKKVLRACAEAGINDVIFGAFQSPQ
ncbi:MAG: biopolymer transporter ExbD [bacterium]|nr:biopolymer transporter ExbD [bacterium]